METEDRGAAGLGTPARKRTRVVGALIDMVVLAPVFVVLAMTMGTATSTSVNLSGIPFFLFLAVSLAYFVVAEGVWGKTVGKKLTNMKVVGNDGDPVTWGEVLGRNILRIIDGLFFYLVGFIVMIFADDNRRLGDIVSDTLVVDED